MRHRALLAIVALAVVVAACGRPASSGPTDAVHVVATTTILADLVRQVGGSHVVVTSLVPKGGEVHTFDPRPSSLRAVAEAALVVRNGLGLDDWLAALVRDTGATAPVVAVAENLQGVTYLAAGGGAGTVNPHVWMNAAYAALMVARIAEALEAADPAHAAAYADGAARYAQQLTALDAETRARLAAIPVANRKVIAFHDAFPYFAAAYGLAIDGTIVAAPGQDPSAGTVAHLVDVIRANGIRAIFAEAQFNDELARMIARDTGVTVVSDLYTDSVGDPPRDTYLGVMRWNVDRVVEALSQP
jgi:ABC-type Zn uptake system ZnuABC Zn-binding protein ZnuA